MTRISAIALALILAASALAVTVPELQDRADALEATYASLLDRAEACPDGTCADAVAIEADDSAAEADRSALEADRATIDPCPSCLALDETIASIGAKSMTMRSILDGWDGQS